MSGKSLSAVNVAFRSGRAKSVTTEENIHIISEKFGLNPQTSQRRASHERDIARSNLRRIMRDLKLKPYIPRLL